MSTVSYALAAPPVADLRGGDCRARDLDQNRHIHGPHRFAATTHAQISNGLLRLTVGASGAAPSLTVEARRGRVIIEDYISDTVSDTVPGAWSTPAWFAMGTLTIDSPSVSALLTAVQVVRINPEAVTIRLVAPLMADAYVTLPRGWRSVRIQHGRTRSPRLNVTRRVRWTSPGTLTGTASTGRVEEMAPATDGFPRWVAAIDPATANAGTFSLSTTATTTARFGAGVGTWATQDRPSQQHGQLGDASRPRLVVA